MLGEFHWDHLNELTEMYAAAYAQGDQLPRTERQVVEACAEVASQPLRMDDFSALLDTQSRGRDGISRKIAWQAQQVLSARSWCVGQKILLGRRHDSSPLIDQIRMLGVDPAHVPLPRFFEMAKNQPFDVQTKIDSLLVDMDKNTIFVVKGCSYSQARKVSRNLILATAENHLFVPKDRVLANVRVPSDLFGSLVLAHGILKSAFPNMNVLPLFMVVDDPDCGWHFQLHNVSEAIMQDCQAGLVDLDRFDVYASSLDFASALQEDSDFFAHPPKWKTTDHLACAPIDRPTRSLMMLNELWLNQQQSGDLAPLSSTELAQRVCERYSIVYTNDLRRHDLEDCLRASGFIKRPRYLENNYAITPTGVLRVFLIRAKFFGRANPDLPQKALVEIKAQAGRWRSYRDGQAPKGGNQ